MKKNVIWNTAGSVFYSFCQWLITILVVHLGSYEYAGYLSLAMTTSSSFAAISLFSMRNFQVSDVKGEYSSDIYVGSRILTCVIAFICCSVSAFVGNSLYQVLCIDAFMLIRVAESLVDVLHGVNQKYNHYDYIGKSYILRALLTVVIFCIGLLLWNNLPLALFVIAAANLMVAFLFDWRLTWNLEHFTPRIWNSKVWNLLKVCFPIVIFSFLLSLENLIPKTFLQQQFGTEELGIYSSIASPTLVVQVFASVAFNPFLPYFSELYVNKKTDQLKKVLHKTYILLIAMCICVTIGAVLLGKIGLTILFGRQILEYYNLFMPIVWCTILTAIVWIFSAILIAFRQIKWLVVGMIVDFLGCICLVRPVVLQYEKNGVSIVQLMVLAVYIMFMVGVCEITLYKQKRCNEI